jgi:hypothetical protein
MYCPSCGAQLEKQNQRYCQQCGATLPIVNTPDAPLVRRVSTSDLPVATGGLDRQTGSLMGMVPDTFKNRLLIGAGAGVVGLVVVYWVVTSIVHVLISLLPFIIVVAAIYAGYRYWRSRL